MTEFFSNLSSEEYSKLKSAIATITVLVAGADNNFDQDEMTWAKKVTEIRGYKMNKELLGYYQEVGTTFVDDTNRLIAESSKNNAERTQQLLNILADLNPIMAKLDLNVGSKLYKSFVSFAEHVAKSSGGVIGFFTIGSEEAKLIQLPTITPIINSDEEE